MIENARSLTWLILQCIASIPCKRSDVCVGLQFNPDGKCFSILRVAETQLVMLF